MKVAAMGDTQLREQIWDKLGWYVRYTDRGQDAEAVRVYEDIIQLIKARDAAVRKELQDKLAALSQKYDLPSITTWKQGKFIDHPRYRGMTDDWKARQEMAEKTLIRPHGGTSNALFQVGANGFNGADITAYLDEVGSLLATPPTTKEDVKGDE